MKRRRPETDRVIEMSDGLAGGRAKTSTMQVRVVLLSLFHKNLSDDTAGRRGCLVMLSEGSAPKYASGNDMHGRE